ncbi:hypothetical protein JCM6882_008172 [Rhodosporidiobolus microsporus]
MDKPTTARTKSHASRACTTCRRSRTRCLPGRTSGVCQRCETKELECQWETGPDRRRNRVDTQAHVEQLQIRVAELEAQLLLMSTRPSGPAPVPAVPVGAANGAEVAPQPAQMQMQTEAEKTPAPATVERTTTPPTGQLRADETGELHWHTETNVFDPSLADRCPIKKSDASLAFLPVPLDNKLHVELIELAFAWHFSVFRILERKDVEICSDRLLTYSPFVHLTVLAVGCRYLHDAPSELYGTPGDPATRGEPFVDAALELLVTELSNPKLSTILGLVILATYVGGVNAPRAGWLYAGLACRLCIDFGLHIDPASSAPIDPSLRLLRRRIFWLCFSHDVSWAVCLGRRSAFSLGEVHQPPLPLPEGELLPGDGAAWPFEVRLNVLAWKIVELNYTDEGRRMGARERGEKVREVWAELGEWYESLPPIYRGASMFIKSPDTLQLNLHYNTLTILLLKPFYAPTSTSTSATESALVLDASIPALAHEHCAAAAAAIVDLMERALLHGGAMSIQIAASYLPSPSPSPSSAPNPSSLAFLSDPHSDFSRRLRAVDSALRLLRDTAKSWESPRQSHVVLGRLRAGLVERVRELVGGEGQQQQQKKKEASPPQTQGLPVPPLAPLAAATTATPPEAAALPIPPSSSSSISYTPLPLPSPAPLASSSALPLTNPQTHPFPAFDLNFDLNFGGVDFDLMAMGGGGPVFGGAAGVPLEQYLSSGWTAGAAFAPTPSYLGGL